MRLNPLRVLLFIVLTASHVVAQSQSTPSPTPSPSQSPAKTPIPDFSGTWACLRGEEPPGQACSAMNLGKEFTVVQDGKTLTMTNSGARGGVVKKTYYLDGTVSLQESGAPAKLTWDGAKVTFVENTAARQNTQMWSLDSAGLLTVQSYFGSGGGNRTTVIFQRK